MKRENPRTSYFAIFSLSALIVLMAVATGCQEKKPVATDEERMTFLVAHVRKASLDPKKFQLIFAEGAMPGDSQRERYRDYSYEVTSPQVEGDTATATVVIREVKTSKVIGEQEWSAVRVGESWKLKSAPLP